MGEEVICEPSPTASPARHARGSILLTARAALFDGGYRERYEAVLPPSVAAALGEVVPGNWLAIDVVRAHYRACDSLGLSANNIAAIGRGVNDRIKGTLYGTFIRAFQEVGGTPWAVFPHWQRFWDRGYDGGALRIVKLGPKDARVEVIGCALCESHYFRNSLRGLSNGFIEVFCKRAYATEVGYGSDGLSFRYQWA